MTIAIPNQVNPFAPRKYGELNQITDKVYIFRNITNSSFVIGDRSVAVIDTQVNHPLAEILVKHIRSVTDKPIEWAINTHYHWDHTNGNAIFKREGAKVIASNLTKEFMTTRHDRQKAFLEGRGFVLPNDPLLPDVTFEGEYHIDLGNMPVHLFFAGKAESDDATAIHLPTERIVMAGDTVMTGSFPIFGQPVWDEGLEGTGQWINTIHELTKLEPKHILPGHGPLAYEKEIDLLIRIQEYFVDEVRALLDRGCDLNQVLNDLEPRLPQWITSIPEVWGTPRYAILRVFRSLTQQALDKELGWQQFKPAAIPSSNQTAKEAKELQEYQEMASEVVEGGDVGFGINILRAATSTLKHDPNAWSSYADLLINASRSVASVLEKGDFFSEAKRSWQTALALDEKHIPSLLGQGRYWVMMAYRGGDDPKPGMQILRNVIELGPDRRSEAEAQFFIGMGYRRLGDEANAKRQFELAKKADLTFVPAQLALMN